MGNIKLYIAKSTINESHSHDNQGINVQKFPIFLKNVIDTWGAEIRDRKQDGFYDYYGELADRIGRAVPTLRSYTRRDNPVYPPANVLYAICVAINDFSPLEYLAKLKDSV